MAYSANYPKQKPHQPTHRGIRPHVRLENSSQAVCFLSNQHFPSLLVLLGEASSQKTDDQPVWEQLKHQENSQKDSVSSTVFF